jgi:uncharacterized protein YeaO (DUF488 family)
MSTTRHPIRIKRVYEAADEADGFRVLVDRVWPRGITKEKAAVDLWMKEIGPSSSLRKWFGHEPERWEEFRTRYRKELDEKQALLDELGTHARKGPLTLVYSAKDEERNQAVVIKQALQREPAAAGRQGHSRGRFGGGSRFGPK